MDKDYYKILGIEKDATPDEIKKAYRKMAMKYHPDRNNGSSESESKFKEAAEAYDTLSNPEKRSNYDRFGTSNPSFGGFGGGGFNMDDIFSNFGDIFGNAFNNRYQTQIKKGSDLRIKVILSIDDILNGTKRSK
jgi:molecular chaperone DnaJ